MLRCKTNGCRGFVLVMVLICLQLAMLFGLYALQTSSLEVLTSHKAQLKLDFINKTEQALKTLEAQTNEQLFACQIPIMSLSELAAKPIPWWEAQSCAGNFQSIQYYYVVELLGEDKCAHIKWTRGKVADYYRITLLGFDQKTKNSLMLQSTIIKAQVVSEECEKDMHQVELGRQSWRSAELSSNMREEKS